MTRYVNLDGEQGGKRLRDVLRWKLGGRDRPAARAPTQATPWVANDGARLVGAPEDALTFIGHASWLVQMGGRSLLVDPIYADGLLVVKRAAAPGLTIEALPKIDAVLITHNHRDHLDAASLRAISARHARAGERAPLHVVPSGVGAQIDSRLGKIVELGWWEHVDVGEVRITFVPSQHWSQRGVFDRNRTLWGGYVIEHGGVRVYHSGDTAWFEGFREIGKRLGKIHAAMLPIGAYEPRWFMKAQHMNPDDAVQAFLDLGAERFIAMHWGTFGLTDEPLDEPPRRLGEVLVERKLEDDAFHVPAVGETIALR